jgi:hypothetical protein
VLHLAYDGYDGYFNEVTGVGLLVLPPRGGRNHGPARESTLTQFAAAGWEPMGGKVYAEALTPDSRVVTLMCHTGGVRGDMDDALTDLDVIRLTLDASVVGERTTFRV